MGKVLKIREVGDPILNKISDEVDIDGVILDYERVLKTYGDLYDFIELKKDGIINRNEHYLRNRYDWTDEERMNFINKYFYKCFMYISIPIRYFL